MVRPSGSAQDQFSGRGPDRLWIDPLRWSWLVRCHGILLAIGAWLEYSTAAQDILGRWLPQAGTPVSALGWLAVLFTPFLASQLSTLAWLCVVRVPVPANDRATRLACSVLASGSRRSRWRSPVVMTGDVAQPHMVSVLGAPFLVLPPRLLRTFHHARESADADEAFRAVLLHELGHLELWDDVLFAPALTYVVCGFALSMVGVGLAVADRAGWSVPVRHLLLLVALVLLSRYVVRRREAYSDAFAAVVARSDRAVRDALRIMQAQVPSSHGFLASHFSTSDRLVWLDGCGKPFVSVSGIDLALIALLNLAVGGNVLAGLLSESALRAREWRS